jgi:hypothetical protein
MVMFQMVKQALDFNKTAVDCAFDTAETIQAQTEKLMGETLDRAPWFPESGRQAIDMLSTQAKNTRDQVRKNTDDYFQKFGKMFD